MEYIKVAFFGLVAALVAAFALAGISISMGDEYAVVVALFVAVPGIAVKFFVPEDSVVGAVIGVVMGAFAGLLYVVALEQFGYEHVDGDAQTFATIAFGAVMSGVIAYNKEKR